MSNDPTQPPRPSGACTATNRPLSLPPREDLQAVIQRLQAELVACQRLAMLGSMAAMVAHEFNNLLTPITARAEAALMSGDDVPFMRKALERALVQAQRAMAVTRHLLDLAHNQARPVETCSLAAAVREAIETMTRPLDKDGIELRVSVPEHLLVCAREDLLCQVLLNLLLNARQAMKGGGGQLSVAAVAHNDHIQIDVRDSGCGIPRELLDNVFNPFLAANPHERANDWHAVGLGLSVCRVIAHHHGATIQGLANEDRGCTFRLCWPAAGATSAPAGRPC